MKRTLEPNQIKLFLKILNLLESVMSKYEDASYEAAINGLGRGLKKYSEKEETDAKLDLYLVWWIRTAIEHDLGIKNENTQIWEKEGYGDSKPF